MKIKTNFDLPIYKVTKPKPNCGCPLSNYPIKRYVPVETDEGKKGYILLSDEEYKKLLERIKEKQEIREVFE